MKAIRILAGDAFYIAKGLPGLIYHYQEKRTGKKQYLLTQLNVQVIRF